MPRKPHAARKATPASNGRIDHEDLNNVYMAQDIWGNSLHEWRHLTPNARCETLHAWRPLHTAYQMLTDIRRQNISKPEHQTKKWHNDIMTTTQWYCANFVHILHMVTKLNIPHLCEVQGEPLGDTAFPTVIFSVILLLWSSAPWSPDYLTYCLFISCIMNHARILLEFSIRM